MVLGGRRNALYFSPVCSMQLNFSSCQCEAGPNLGFRWFRSYYEQCRSLGQEVHSLETSTSFHLHGLGHHFYKLTRSSQNEPSG